MLSILGQNMTLLKESEEIQGKLIYYNSKAIIIEDSEKLRMINLNCINKIQFQNKLIDKNSFD